MNQAMTCVDGDDPATLRRYQAVGFQIKHKLLTFAKEV
jgi:hypothetical protein